jgi:hypothetical protein
MDDALLAAAKTYAAENNTTLTAVIEDALRETLSRRAQPKSREPIKFPTFKGRGLQPGVDLDSSSSLLGLMEENR